MSAKSTYDKYRSKDFRHSYDKADRRRKQRGIRRQVNQFIQCDKLEKIDLLDFENKRYVIGSISPPWDYFQKLLEKYEGQSFDIVYSKLKNNIPKQFCEDIKLLIFYNANAKFKWYGGKFVVYNNKIYNVSNMKDCCLMCNTLIFENVDLNYIKSTFLSLDKTCIYVMCNNCVRAHIHKDPNIIDETVTELDYKKYKMLL